MRRQPYAEAAGGAALDASDPQVAVCSTCRTVLEFDTDGMGNLREWCPTCRARRRLQASRTRTALVSSTIAELLPLVAPGQLRCQRCARGVDGRARFCTECRRAAISTAMRGRVVSDATRAKMRAAMLGRTRVAPVAYQAKTCACGVVFTPRAPWHRWHAPDCSARPSKRTKERTRSCLCGATFTRKQGKRYCSADCPARTRRAA